MSKSRVEAFSDGVIAIIITILVLELKLPEHHHSLEAILELKYNFIAYAVSFIAIATIWISHHHLLNQISEITNKILWANINFLFWLSLLPTITAWFGHDIMSWQAALLYNIDIIAFNLSFMLLRNQVIKLSPKTQNHHLSETRVKEMISFANNVITLIISFFFPPYALIGLLLNILIWVIPFHKQHS